MLDKLLAIAIACCLLIINTINSDICYSKEIFTRMFIIGHNIYLGSDLGQSKYNLDTHLLSDSQQIHTLFGSDFESIGGGFLFDFDPCDGRRSAVFCNNARKAKDLAIVFGSTRGSDRRYGYNSYNSVLSILTQIYENDKMPWNLPAKGNLKESFWLDDYMVGGTAGGWNYSGLTFHSDGHTDRLYASVQTGYGVVYMKEIKSDGTFDTQWRAVGYERYNGILDVYGYMFGLGESNTVWEMVWRNGEIENNRSWTTKQFLNCYGDSILLTLKKPTLPPITTTPTTTTTRRTTKTTTTTTTPKPSTRLTTTASSKRKTETTISETESETEIYTDLTETTVYSDLTDQRVTTTLNEVQQNSGNEKRNSKWWIFLLAFLFVIILLIILLCVLWRKCRKSKDSNAENRIKLIATKPEQDQQVSDSDESRRSVTHNKDDKAMTPYQSNASVSSRRSRQEANTTQMANQSKEPEIQSNISLSSRRSGKDHDIA